MVHVFTSEFSLKQGLRAPTRATLLGGALFLRQSTFTVLMC